MLSGAFSKMGANTFSNMLTSAVEAYNRVSKSGNAEPLNIAMLGKYKYDMAAVLEHTARQEGVLHHMEDMSFKAQRQCAQKQKLDTSQQVAFCKNKNYIP